MYNYSVTVLPVCHELYEKRLAASLERDFLECLSYNESLPQKFQRSILPEAFANIMLEDLWTER